MKTFVIPYLSFSLLLIMYQLLLASGIVTLSICMILWGIKHKIYRGLKYCYIHALLDRKIKKSLKNAGYYIEGLFFGEKVIILPKIKIKIDSKLACGKIEIENHIKFDKKLEDVNISSALKKYIVQQQYISDDANFYIYEFEDATIDRQLVFNDYESFAGYAKSVGDYKFFMDNRTIVPLTHLLLAGSTGSGKTYASYSLVLTMLSWDVKPDIYFSDPKNSSLAVLGNHITPDKTAGEINEIIQLLEQFFRAMQERKRELGIKLNEKLDADYRYWNMPAQVFIIDEFAGFISAINGMEKKTRDSVNLILRDIVLQGRQLGFFLWIMMQKTDATELPTQIRSNLIWKVVLGNATRTTYQTAFEESANLPCRNFAIGHGLYHYQGLTREPQLISFPTLNFDILKSVEL